MPPFIVSQSTNWWELSVLADNIAEDEEQNNPPDEIQKGLDTQIWGWSKWTCIRKETGISYVSMTIQLQT